MIPGRAKPLLLILAFAAVLAAPGPFVLPAVVVAGLAAAVTRLSEHPGLRESLVRSGYATARRYTQQRFHAAIEQRLAETVARGPLP